MGYTTTHKLAFIIKAKNFTIRKFFMKNNILYAILFCSIGLGFSTNSFAQQQPANLIDYSTPQSYQIGGITTTGTKFLDQTVLINLSGLAVGDKINVPGDDIANAVKALWKQGLFSDVKIVADRIVNDVIFLEIQLKERERLSKYTFKGVAKGEEDDLRDKIGLVRGRIVDEDVLTNTRSIVTEHFRDKGFFNTSVNIIQQPDSLFTNSVILSININKNEKVRIRNIQFSGNDNVASRKLKKQMKDTKERTRLFPRPFKEVKADMKNNNPLSVIGNFSTGDVLTFVDENLFRFRLFSTSKFNEEDYQTSKDALITYYNNQGYRDATIATDTVYSVDGRNLNIDINLSEGNRYYFRNISFKGNSKYSSDLLSRILGIKKGDVYSQATVQSRIYQDPNSNDISSLYMDDGYLFFQVTPIETATEGDSIDMEVNIYEGPQATVDKILISGNTKTNEHVIRREIRSLPGNKFSRTDIIRTTREIANLGFFDPEKIEVNPIPNPTKGTVDIEYKVAEKPADQLELSAGWGGTGVIGTIGVSFNNFSIRNIFKKDSWQPLPSGDGERLSFRLQSTGPNFQSINTSFTEPWLGGKRPNALTVGFYTSRIYSPARSNTAEQLRYIVGASVALGRRLRRPDDNFSLQNELNYQYFNLKNSREFIIQNGDAHNFSLRTTLSRYSIDQPIYPRSGSNISLSLAITPPWSAMLGTDLNDATIEQKYRLAEYHKWKLRAEWFTPIAGKLVLRTVAKMGMMGFYNSKIGYSAIERFEMGGDGLGVNGAAGQLFGKDIFALRGYEENEVTQGQFGDPFMAKYTVELRYPFSLNPSSTIYALAFAEGGNTWSDVRYFNPFDVKRTTGLGLRIYLPMFGTLGFDYGIGYDKNYGQNNSFGDYLRNNGRFSVILGFEPE